MRHRQSTAIVAAMLLGALPVRAQPAGPIAPAKPVFRQDSLNVFRRFPIELRPRMVEFYGTVLGLKPLSPITLSPGQQVMLFRIGTGQLKLAPGMKGDRTYHPGAPGEATGIRLFTLRYPDAEKAALTARFTAAGYPPPRFSDVGRGRRVALVTDPAGFTLELALAPDASDVPAGLDVGVAVTDLARSRSFYRDFCGLEELPPVKDPALGITVHPFRHGETTLNLWQARKGLPADTGSAGIQYVVSNVDAVNAAAQERHVTVETPLGGVPGFDVKTVWLNDPDGVTNYFYQLMRRPPST